MRRTVRWALRATAAVACAALAACGTAQRIAFTPGELREAAAHKVGAERAAALRIPFEVDDQLVAVSRRVIAGSGDHEERIGRLALALADPDVFGLRYDPTILTGEAREIVDRGRAACVSLTALFVGLARANGLQVYFVDARGVQEFQVRGSLYLDLRHMVAGYGTPPRFRIVDFDRTLAPDTKFRVLTDVQALARYYNNLGYEELHAERYDAAEDRFRTSMALDPGFAAAYNNLGVALMRQERYDEARAAFDEAMVRDPVYSSPLANAALMYERLDRPELAAEMRARAGPLKLRDPLWRLQQGKDAARAGDLARAVAEFRAALSLDPDLVTARLRLAAAYEAMGDRRRAVRALDYVLARDPGNAEARAMRRRLTGAPAPRAPAADAPGAPGA